MSTPHLRSVPSAGDLSAASTDPSPRCDSCVEEEPEIRDYLDRVCAPLIGKVPYARRMELRRELAEHLEALADAYEERGAVRAAAVQQALEQFGTPDQVGRQWLSAWRQGAPPPPAAHSLSLGCFVLSSWLGCMLQVSLARQAGFVPSEALYVGPLLPVLGGLALGSAHRNHPWITRIGLAVIPLLGTLAAAGISLRADVSPQAAMTLAAVSWGILGASTAGIVISADAWLRARFPRYATR